MVYPIQKTEKKPVYIQLYEFIKKDITGGIYSYGTKLPSKRVISEETGVSIITVEHSLSLLCDEGYIESRERSGFYVTYSETALFSPPEAPEPSLPFSPHGSAEEDAFPFSVLAKTMRSVLTDYGENILIKSPNFGMAELRTALSKYLLRSRGMTLSPDQIIIGSGAEYLYSLIVQTLGRKLTYAIEKPSYEKIEAVYKANGVKLDMLALGPDGIKSQELTETKASVLHITPYRSFPSGVTADASKRQEYIRWAGKTKYIIEDDFESEFTLSTKPEETVFSLSQNENVIYINTFSKTVAPAVRIGYMVVPAGFLPLFQEKVGFYSCTVPAFDQLAIARLISSGDFERHINRVRRRKRAKNR